MWFIIRFAASASRRRAPLSSNVRHHNRTSHVPSCLNPKPYVTTKIMSATAKLSLALALLAATLVGCGTTYVPQDHWTYSGKDEAVRSPPRIPRGALTASAWVEAMRASTALWWQEREVHVQRAKDSCARETGESETPGYWFGYARAFKACMAASGWTEGRSPL